METTVTMRCAWEANKDEGEGGKKRERLVWMNLLALFDKMLSLTKDRYSSTNLAHFSLRKREKSEKKERMNFLSFPFDD